MRGTLYPSGGPSQEPAPFHVSFKATKITQETRTRDQDQRPRPSPRPLSDHPLRRRKKGVSATGRDTAEVLLPRALFCLNCMFLRGLALLTTCRCDHKININRDLTYVRPMIECLAFDISCSQLLSFSGSTTLF